MVRMVDNHPDLFDYAASRAARDEGMARVMEHNPEFSEQFARYIENLPHGWVGQCEDIRQVWTGVQPASFRAWGSCWGAAKRRGLLVELSEQRHMTAVKSHGRKTHLHRRV